MPIACSRGRGHGSAKFELMKYYDYFALFGLFCFVLAAIAGIRAKSRASLLAGGISGMLLLVATLMAMKRKDVEGLNYGYVVGLVTSGLLLGRFLPSWIKTKKLYPAGIMALLSLFGLVAGILGLMKIGPLQ